MLSKRLKIYLGFIYVLAIICSISIVMLYHRMSTGIFTRMTFSDFLVFLVLAILADSFIVIRREIAFGTGFAVTIVLILKFGIMATMIIKGMSIALRVIRHKGKYVHIFNTPIYKLLFNISIAIIPSFLAGLVYYSFKTTNTVLDPITAFIRIILFITVFLLVQMFIGAVLVTILTSTKFSVNFTKYLRFSILDIVFIAPFGIILFYIISKYNVIGIISYVFAIFILRYVLKLYLEE